VPSGIALCDPAVRAIRPEEREKVVGEVVAIGLGRRPPDGDRQLGSRTEAEEPGDPLGI
jgi:hypothetical protein